MASSASKIEFFRVVAPSAHAELPIPSVESNKCSREEQAADSVMKRINCQGLIKICFILGGLTHPAKELC